MSLLIVKDYVYWGVSNLFLSKVNSPEYLMNIRHMNKSDLVWWLNQPISRIGSLINLDHDPPNCLDET